MDTSKEYIMMCERAREIQDIRWSLGVFPDGAKRRDFYGRVDTEVPNVFETVWLPRQDQLQEMLGYQLGGLIDLWCQWIDRATFPKNTHNSMEQLWLAFVMREKFGKVWTGEDWITPPCAGKWV